MQCVFQIANFFGGNYNYAIRSTSYPFRNFEFLATIKTRCFLKCLYLVLVNCKNLSANALCSLKNEKSGLTNIPQITSLIDGQILVANNKK